MRHERPHQHVADPALVRPFRFEASKGSRWLAGQRGTVEATSAEVGADGALGNAHAVTGFENGGDLCRRTGWQFLTQLARLLQQVWMPPHGAKIGARWWSEP